MNYLLIGSISGCCVIILGAFGSHSLKEILNEHGKSIYDKAVLYHMFHTFAILMLGLINNIQPETDLSFIAWTFIFGIILFSGSLYLLAITNIKLLGMITPIGGLLFIIAWILLAVKKI